MLNVEMQTYTYIGSTIVQIYYTILADIVRHTQSPRSQILPHHAWHFACKIGHSACTQIQRLFHKKYSIKLSYRKYTTSLMQNGGQISIYTNHNKANKKQNW